MCLPCRDHSATHRRHLKTQKRVRCFEVRAGGRCVRKRHWLSQAPQRHTETGPVVPLDKGVEPRDPPSEGQEIAVKGSHWLLLLLKITSALPPPILTCLAFDRWGCWVLALDLYGLRRLTAFKRPSRAGAVLYVSSWPLTNVSMPAASMSWTCTKTSEPPPSGAIKPNPRSGLKNLTRPLGMPIIQFNARS